MNRYRDRTRRGPAWIGSPLRHFIVHTRIGRLMLVLLLLVLANLAMYLRFQHKTYPHTFVGNQPLGNVVCSDIPAKLAPLPVLPAEVQLSRQKTTTKVAVSALGITIDPRTIAARCRDDRTWLPLLDVFIRHNLTVRVRVSDHLFQQGLGTVRKAYDKQVADAQLILEDGLFVVKPSVEGITVNAGALKQRLIETLEAGGNKLELPVTVTAPEQLQLDQEYLWEQLVKEQHTAIMFQYAGKTKQLTAQEVVQWYVPDKRSYVVSNDKIRDTITQLGKEAKLDIQNTDQAIAAVKQALQAQQSLAFTLLGPPN